MGQFLAVSTADPSRTQALLCGGARAAQDLFGVHPESNQNFGSSGILGFRRIASRDESGRLVCAGRIEGWCLGVGTWVDRACCDGQPPLERLAAAGPQSTAVESALAHIDGCYGFVTGGGSGDRIHVITDRIGQLHVYTLSLAGEILVSTSALLLAQLGNCSWDALAVREFLACGTVYEDRSLFDGVRKIPPATIQTIVRGGVVETKRYWSVSDHAEAEDSTERSLARFATAVENGLQGIFQKFARPVLDLTGGFDSRILLATARQGLGRRPIHTVVVGPANDPDVLAAANIALRFRLSHRTINEPIPDGALWWTLAKSALLLVDGEYDILEYARILAVHRALSAEFGISVNGSGGELIRGYWWELLFPRIGARDRFDADKVAHRRYATDLWAEGLLAEDFGNTLGQHFSAVIQRAGSGMRGCRNTAYMDNVYLTLRMQRWQGRISSATNRIWPCASPLLFREPMEAALGASNSLRRNGRMARRVLELLDRDLAKMPMAGGYPATPIRLTTLPRFLPLGKEFVRRIGNRAQSSFRRQTRVNVASVPDPKVDELLNQAEVTQCLNPADMLTAELYTQTALRQVVGAIVAGREPLAHAGRILTLESVARLRRAPGG